MFLFLPVLFKIRLLAFGSFSSCVFSFCFVLAAAYSFFRFATAYLASVAKSSGDPKAASYDIIASRLSISRRISSPCWPTRIFPVLPKRSRRLISHSKRSIPYRTQTRRGRLPYQQPFFHPYQRPPPRVICYRCGEPGQKSP